MIIFFLFKDLKTNFVLIYVCVCVFIKLDITEYYIIINDDLKLRLHNYLNYVKFDFIAN